MRIPLARGFTFLEILFSLLVFSAGMLAYMNYQGRASAMLFDSESSAIANALAIEVSEELNSFTEDDFRTIITNLGVLASDSSATDMMSDADFKATSSLFQFTPGPFDEFGRPVSGGGNAMFHRMMRVYTYNDLTQGNFTANSAREVLRVVEITVVWSNRDDITAQCNVNYNADGCNRIRTYVIKPIFYY